MIFIIRKPLGNATCGKEEKKMENLIKYKGNSISNKSPGYTFFSTFFFTLYKRSVLCNQCYRQVNTFFFYFRAVKFTSKLFGQALSKRIKATILFATETGKSEMYAKKLGEIFSHAFHSQVLR